jgi:DNA-binding NarL/FixJ family response regulator
MQLLLIDDHPIIHVALRSLFAGQTPPVTLHSAETAADARQQLALVANLDMVLLDLELDGHDDGFALLQEIRKAHPKLPIVALSASNEMAKVIRAIDLGAMGFIPKHSAPEEFKEALLLVVTGGIYVPSMRVSEEPMMPPRRRADDLLPRTAPRPAPAGGLASPPRPQVDSLPITPRQKEVLRALLQGKSNKVIANELGISTDTVKDHVAVIFRVLNVSSRTQAVLAVAQWND